MSVHVLKQRLAPLVTPAVFDFWVSRFNRAASWERPLARVIERRIESRNAVTLVLQPNRNFAGFRAGQHLNLSAEVDGLRVTRSYSPSDAPRADGRVSLTVRHVPGGKLSTQLCLRTRVGDVLELGPAFGEMDLHPPSAPQLLCAAGSGITPLMSLLRSTSRPPQPLDIDLIYWARRRAELCFAEELRELSRRLPGLRCHFVLTREAELDAGEPAGRPSAELLSRLVPDCATRRVLACGPNGFVESLRQLLASRVPQFHAESFTPDAVVPTSLTGTVRVELAKTGRVLELAAGDSLLEALEAQGLRPAYGCRMGLCNTCACGKRAGTTQHLISGDTDAEPSSALRLCVNRAASDLVLDI